MIKQIYTSLDSEINDAIEGLGKQAGDFVSDKLFNTTSKPKEIEISKEWVKDRVKKVDKDRIEKVYKNSSSIKKELPIIGKVSNKTINLVKNLALIGAASFLAYKIYKLIKK